MSTVDPLDTRGAFSYAAIRAAEEAAPRNCPDEIAEAFVANLSDADLHDFAVAYVADRIAGIRRARARLLEARAFTPATAAAVSAHIRPDDREPPDFGAVRDNPSLGWKLGKYERKRFRRWMGGEFDAWCARGLEMLADDEDALHSFRADWHPLGRRAYYFGALMDDVQVLVERLASRVRLELTRELLDSQFALGDGTVVTWASATPDQHELRARLLVSSSTGTAETAALHIAAARMIRGAGVGTLAEVESCGAGGVNDIGQLDVLEDR